MSPFEPVMSRYGTVVINRHDRYQYEPLITTGTPHIQREIDQILEIISQLSGDSVMVDGGANCGLITLPLALTGKGVVHSFEPQPMLHHCLCAAVALNFLTNVEVYQCGLSDRDELMSLPVIDYGQPHDFGSVALRKHRTDRQSVVVKPLDDLLTRLDFLKLDVESMELKALHGAASLIARCRPWCWVEYLRSDLEQLISFFTIRGYNVYRIDEANMVAAPDDTRMAFMGDRLG